MGRTKVKITRDEHIGWEPLRMRFVPRRGKKLPAGKLREFLQLWFVTVQSGNLYGCAIKYTNISGVGDDGVGEAVCEFFSEEAVVALGDALSAAVPEVGEIILGDKLQDAESSAGVEWIRVPEKSVDLGEGRVVQVAAFEVAKHPVRVKDFLRFAEATGYVTLAEKKGPADNTFRLNHCMFPLNERARAELEVTCVNWHDAQAYCQWSGTRLMTEAEYLAAWILDSGIYSDEEWDRRFKRWSKRKDALECWTWEWTAEREGGRAVARSGPTFARCEEDLDPRRNRHLASLDDYSLMKTFRICRDLR